MGEPFYTPEQEGYSELSSAYAQWEHFYLELKLDVQPTMQATGLGYIHTHQQSQKTVVLYSWSKHRTGMRYSHTDFWLLKSTAVPGPSDARNAISAVIKRKDLWSSLDATWPRLHHSPEKQIYLLLYVNSQASAWDHLSLLKPLSLLQGAWLHHLFATWCKNMPGRPVATTKTHKTAPSLHETLHVQLHNTVLHIMRLPQTWGSPSTPCAITI